MKHFQWYHYNHEKFSHKNKLYLQPVSVDKCVCVCVCSGGEGTINEICSHCPLALYVVSGMIHTCLWDMQLINFCSEMVYTIEGQNYLMVRSLVYILRNEYIVFCQGSCNTFLPIESPYNDSTIITT